MQVWIRFCLKQQLQDSRILRCSVLRFHSGNYVIEYDYDKAHTLVFHSYVEVENERVQANAEKCRFDFNDGEHAIAQFTVDNREAVMMQFRAPSNEWMTVTSIKIREGVL